MPKLGFIVKFNCPIEYMGVVVSESMLGIIFNNSHGNTVENVNQVANMVAFGFVTCDFGSVCHVMQIYPVFYVKIET